MGPAVSPMILGILISLLGVSNMKGNLSSIHRYHRHRVREEDRAAFGRLMGLGTLIAGLSVALMGCGLALAELLQAEVWTLLGSVIVAAGCAVGLGLSFYAMFKYNKGIF